MHTGLQEPVGFLDWNEKVTLVDEPENELQVGWIGLFQNHNRMGMIGSLSKKSININFTTSEPY